MKVYVLVYHYPYEGDNVMAVFATQQAATDYAKKNNYSLDSTSLNPYVDIEEHEVQE